MAGSISSRCACCPAKALVPRSHVACESQTRATTAEQTRIPRGVKRRWVTKPTTRRLAALRASCSSVSDASEGNDSTPTTA
eukprot:49837-Pleurochrysis_carterae.AAC.3